MAVVKDLTGKRFGRLVAVSCVGRTTNGNAKWLCRCDCGGTKIVASWGLVSGNTQSCGCIKAEQNKEMFTKHGDAAHGKRNRLYRIWAGAKTRCYNQRQQNAFRKYGAKGVQMCDEWRNSYESFKLWALENGYDDSLTLDRVDPAGPYSPENCRWATQKQQQNNRTNNRRIEFNGHTKTLAEWADATGFTKSTIEHRLSRGWSVTETLQTPMRVVKSGRTVYVDSKFGG